MPTATLIRPDPVVGTANALPLMARAAIRFRERLLAEPGCIPLPTPYDPKPPATLRWDNVLLRSPRFRRAHVETFDVPERLSVLHVCVMPHLDDPTPIYGFDMVAGPSRVTGIFLDLSPVTGSPSSPSLCDVLGRSALRDFAVKRDLPEWGDIFSNDMLAIRPADVDEVTRAISLALQTLDAFLGQPRLPSGQILADIAAGQARYNSGQRRNEHTFRMLASFIGAIPARRFIDEVLFPLEQTVSA